jgi:hypothetical protein
MFINTGFHTTVREAVEEMNAKVAYGEVASFQVIAEPNALSTTGYYYCIVAVLAK